MKVAQEFCGRGGDSLFVYFVFFLNSSANTFNLSFLWFGCLFCLLSFFQFKFIYFNWRIITLQYCIGFAIYYMNLPRVYTCSPSWASLPPPSPYHPSGSSQRTSPKHPVSCIKTGLVIHFLYDIIHVSMPFSQIIPPSSSITECKRLFYTSVSLLLSW